MRLAVEAGDVAELHRSLAPLVAKGPCSDRLRGGPMSIQDEVLGLRLLYLTHGGLEGEPGCLEGELLDFFREKPSSITLAESALGYARRVHDARVVGLWVRHLRLAGCQSKTHGAYVAAGESRTVALCSKLANLLSPAVRSRALAALVRAFPH